MQSSDTSDLVLTEESISVESSGTNTQGLSATIQSIQSLTNNDPDFISIGIQIGIAGGGADNSGTNDAGVGAHP